MLTDAQIIKKKKTKTPSTQSFLPIAEIKDGTVVLKDGGLRKVLITSSINFALKSDDEQQALVSAYVGFLNSLEFPIQIVVQSRRLKIAPYLEMLNQHAQAQTNELMRIQIEDYRSFVAELVDLGQIMTKQFYVIVPYDARVAPRKTFFERFKEVMKPAVTLKLKDERFLKRKEDIDSRVRIVQGGLSSMGLTVAELDTQALIELYYNTYNPELAFAQPLSKVEEMRVENSI